MPPLVPCPHCREHCKMTEDACPHCGRGLRSSDGRIPTTAAAVVLGLSMAAAASCEGTSVPVYGSPETTEPVTGSGGAGGDGGAGEEGGGGSGGAEAAPDYGVPGVGGGG